MTRLWRRLLWAVFVAGLLAIAALWSGQKLLDYWGGHWTHAPEDAAWVLGPAARRLIDQTFIDAHDKTVIDHDVQVLTRGDLSGASFVNHSQPAGGDDPGPLLWLDNQRRAHAGGIAGSDQPDAMYISRLLRQMHAMPHGYDAWLQSQDVRTVPVVAFGAHATPAHQNTSDVVDTATAASAAQDVVQAQPAPRLQAVVTNRYVRWLADQAPQNLAAVVSIMPSQDDQDAQLQSLLAGGARRLRWNPALAPLVGSAAQQDQAVETMAARLAELKDVTLQLSVGGWQGADGHDVWVPLELARSLLAHKISVQLVLGRADADNGHRQFMPGLFDLLAEKLPGRLSISLSGLLAQDRIASQLLPLLQHPQFYDRLVYASGYPDSAVPGAVALDALIDQGFVDASLESALAEIYQVNPLLFVLTVWRAVHLPETHLRLPAEVFFAH